MKLNSMLFFIFCVAITAMLYVLFPEHGVAASGAMLVFGTVYSESNYLGDIILNEEDREFSRDVVTVLSGQNLLIGTVLGKITSSCPATGTAGGGNTGNGTCTTVTAGALIKLGTYTLRCIAAGANSGTFAVIAPDGTLLPDATVAVAYTSTHINFTINDGATDFVVGDTFTIEVTAGSGKVKILTPAAVDGTQNAYGILISDIDASAADKKGVAITREAIAKKSGLVWPGGITEDQKAAAVTELAAKNIIVREDV